MSPGRAEAHAEDARSALTRRSARSYLRPDIAPSHRAYAVHSRESTSVPSRLSSAAAPLSAEPTGLNPPTPVSGEPEVRGVLERVLASGSLLGARLRPLLIEEFQRTTGRNLEPILRSFGKFSSFLTHNCDLVDVRRDDRSTDVRVSLRSAGRDDKGLQPRRRFSSQLWQAFTNPDERRRRFYNRGTQEVVHYLADSPDGLDNKLSSKVDGDDRFVAIEYAHAQEQSRWMQDFLDASVLPESTRRVARHVVTIAYDSAVNTAFESSLGSHGYEWRRYRAKRVSDHIERWAEKNSISFDPGVLRTRAKLSCPLCGSG